jgi:hypothetical protein
MYYNKKARFLGGYTEGASCKPNSQRYRAKEFSEIDWNQSIVVFGCSNVLGVGLTDNETLPYCLEQISGIPTVNLGIGAGSADLMLYNQVALKEMSAKPRAVINLWPIIDRFTFFSKNGYHSLGRWTEGRLRTLFIARNMEDSNAEAHALLSQRIARLLWTDTAYFEATFCNVGAKVLGIPHLNTSDRARDNSHPGPESAKAAAQLIFDNIKEQL